MTILLGFTTSPPRRKTNLPVIRWMLVKTAIKYRVLRERQKPAVPDRAGRSIPTSPAPEDAERMTKQGRSSAARPPERSVGARRRRVTIATGCRGGVGGGQTVLSHNPLWLRRPSAQAPNGAHPVPAAGGGERPAREASAGSSPGSRSGRPSPRQLQLRLRRGCRCPTCRPTAGRAPAARRRCAPAPP